VKNQIENFQLKVKNPDDHHELFNIIEEALNTAKQKGLIEDWQLNEKGTRMRGHYGFLE
jgi:hypothetical protein